MIMSRPQRRQRLRVWRDSNITSVATATTSIAWRYVYVYNHRMCLSDVINRALIDGVTIAARITEKDSSTGKTWTGSGKKRSVKLYVT